MLKKNTQIDKYLLLTLIVLVLLLLLFIFSILQGNRGYSVKEAIKAITSTKSNTYIILYRIRFPRTLLALLYGALVSASSAVMQLYFNNALLDPSIIGVTNGGLFGAVLVKVLGLGGASAITMLNMNVASFIFSILATALLLLLTGGKRRTPLVVVLCGIALGAIFSALTSILVYTSSSTKGLYTYLIGSFSKRGMAELRLCLPLSVLSMLLLYSVAKSLDSFVTGEKTAFSIGVNTNRVKRVVLVSASLAASTCVCMGGSISFIGLITPHIVRRIYGIRAAKARVLTLYSAIYGSFLLLLADVLVRLIAKEAEVPVGLVVSVVGSPLFIALIVTKKKKNVPNPSYIYSNIQSPLIVKDAEKESLLKSIYSNRQEKVGERVIEVNGLSARYKEAPCTLKNISFTLKRGQLVALCGKNGSGKTTLLNILAGDKNALITKGRVFYCEVGKEKLNNKERRKVISHLYQSETPAWDTGVKDYIRLGRLEGKGEVEEVAKFIGLESILNSTISTLSGGEWQKVRLARAVIQGASLLLLDEVTAGLDASYIKEYYKMLYTLSSKYGVTILTSTHSINDMLRYFKEVILIGEGEGIVCDTKSEKIKEAISKSFGSSLTIYYNDVLECYQVK